MGCFVGDKKVIQEYSIDMKYENIVRDFRLKDDGSVQRKCLGSRWGYGWKDVVSRKNTTNGYCAVKLKEGKITLHRLVWMLYNGKNIPKGMDIDHIDGNRINNNPENLRVVSRRKNLTNSDRNRRGGLPGAYKLQSGRWYATIKIKGKSYNLGSYDTKEDAYKAYIRAGGEY